MNMRTIAVILAGGSGARLGGPLPKQFMIVAGRMVIEHTLSVFGSCVAVDEICIVANPKFISLLEESDVRGRFPKLKRIIPGGKERYHSSLAAIESYADEADDCVMMFHDSVRPMVSRRIIDDCLVAMRGHDAVATGIPATDTVWEVNDRDEIIAIPERASLRNAQTPQCFRLGLIREAYRRAMLDPGFHATDDCGVVLKYMPGCPIAVVPGERSNIKLTYTDDVEALEVLLGRRQESWCT